jgi:hypothetical protein
VNQFKSATLTVLIGVPWRTSIYSNPKDNVNPSQVRMDVECYLNLHMPGWHHVVIIDKPVRNLSMPQNSLGQHSVTVEVFYRSDELKRSRMLDQYPRLCRNYETAALRRAYEHAVRRSALPGYAG